MKSPLHLRPRSFVLVFLLCLTLAGSVHAASGIAGRIVLHNRFLADLSGHSGGVTTPFSAQVRVYRAGTSNFVNTITSDAAGRFRIRLRPGHYDLIPETMWQGQVLQPGTIVLGNYQAAEPATVRVRLNRFLRLNLTYEEMMGF
jgi:hypothetical protein